MRFAATLLAASLLAGCHAPTAEPTVHQNDAARANEIEALNGWDRLFDAPDAAVGKANQFGFHPTPYAAKGERFVSTGGPVMIAGSMAKTPSAIAFEASGPGADTVDTVRFDLTLGEKPFVKDARERAAKLVRDYLFQFGIEADALMPAISQGIAARGDLTGTPYTIEPGEGTLTITFTRTGAAAPANSKPQGN